MLNRPKVKDKGRATDRGSSIRVWYVPPLLRRVELMDRWEGCMLLDHLTRCFVIMIDETSRKG